MKERSWNVQSEALGSSSSYAILLHNIRQALPCRLNSLTGRENDTLDFVLFMKSKWNNECDVSDRMSFTLSVMITYFIISLDSALSTMLLPHLRIFEMLYIFIHFWVMNGFLKCFYRYNEYNFWYSQSLLFTVSYVPYKVSKEHGRSKYQTIVPEGKFSLSSHLSQLINIEPCFMCASV